MISIHALRKESDDDTQAFIQAINISIHALRKESDPLHDAIETAINNFNPRSP